MFPREKSSATRVADLPQLNIDFKNAEACLSFIEDEKMQLNVKAEMEALKKQARIYNSQLSMNVQQVKLEKDISRMIQHLKQNDQSIIGYSESAQMAKIVHRDLIGKLEEYQGQIKVAFSVALPARLKELKLDYQQNLLEDNKEVKSEFYKALSKINNIEEEKSYPSAYISHAVANIYGRNTAEESRQWVLPFLEKLRLHLRAAGICAQLFPKDSEDRNIGLYEFTRELPNSTFVLHIGTPELLKKHTKQSCDLVKIEMNMIKDRFQIDAQLREGQRIFPILLDGDQTTSFSIDYPGYTSISDWGNTDTYFQHFRKLIAKLNNRPGDDEKLQVIWDHFLKSIPEAVKQQILPTPEYIASLESPNKVSGSKSLSNKAEEKKSADSSQEILKRLADLQLTQKEILAVTRDTKDTTTKLDATSAEIKVTLDRIEEKEDALLANIDTIMEEYKTLAATPSTSSKTSEEKQFSHPQLNRFYGKFKVLLDDFLSIARLVNEEKIDPDQKRVRQVNSVIEKLLNLIPFPYIGLAAKFLTTAIERVDFQSKKLEAKATTTILGSQATLVSNLAYQVTHNYQRQILEFSDNGIDVFAGCLRKRLLKYIRTLDAQDTTLLDKTNEERIQMLLFGIIDCKSSMLRNTHIDRRVKKDETWTDDGILNRSGLELPEGSRYVIVSDDKNKSSKPEKYHFHFGSIAEQKRYGFMTRYENKSSPTKQTPPPRPPRPRVVPRMPTG